MNKFSDIPGGMSIEDVQVGMAESYSQIITDADIMAYAGISGDKNPVHLDEDYASKSRYKKRIAHGMFSASFFSAIFGTKLPGTGCVYVSQSLEFKRPVYMDDTVVATVVVTAVDREKGRVFFDTVCKVKSKVVINGKAEIFIPRKTT